MEGRQADFYKYQSGRRRTANSEASPSQKSRRTARYSPAEVDAQRAAPSKGFLNRRFKRVFGYFCCGAKVTAGSGAAEAPGYRIETSGGGPAGAAKNPLPIDISES